MATLRKDGRWMARKRLQDGTRIAVYGATEEEANRALAQAIEELATLSNARLTSLHDVALNVWYPRIEHLKPLSKKKYEGVYVNWIRPAIGHIEPNSITVANIQALVNKAAGKRSPRTAAYIRDIVSQILNCAEEVGLVPRNVAKFVKTPKAASKRVRVLTVDQASRLLAHVEDTPMAAPVFLAVVLGLRRGEIAGLQWSDLDRQTGMLTIQRQRQAVRPHGVIETELKTTGSRRALMLTSALIEQLDARGDLDSPYICTYRMEPWVPDTIGEKWNESKPKDLADWTFHDLRHGAAGLLYAMGHDILEIAAVLGHKKPDMSLLYTSELEDRRKTAIASMDALFR